VPNGIVRPGDYIFLFTEGAGTVTYGGYSALEKIGTFGGSRPTWVTGSFGRPALHFGTSHLDFGAGFAFYQTSNAFSGLAWVNTGADGTIFEKWNVQAGVVAGQGGWQFVISGGNAYFGLTNSNGSTLRERHGATNVADGKLHQIAFAYDGSNTAAGIQIYVDGVAESMTTDADTDPGTLQDTNLWVGDRQGVSSLTLTGTIDHAIIHTGQWLAKDIGQLYAEPFLMFGQSPPKRIFFGAGAVTTSVAVFRQRKRKTPRPASRRRRRAAAFLTIAKFSPRLTRSQRRRRSSAAAFRRKRRQVPTEGLLAHGVPPELMKRKQKGRKQPSRRRARRSPLPAPKGGCPTLTVIEAMTATARTIEAFTATALAAERLSAQATTYEAMTATALATEVFTATARVVPCVKG
jgi:Concanavalin A-like lectin/glucanases superfamily